MNGMMSNVMQQTPLASGQSGFTGMQGAPEFDLSQFVGQQADAQRLLGAGEEVVPASTNNPILNGQFGNFNVSTPNPPTGMVRQGPTPTRMTQQQMKAQQMRNVAQGSVQPSQVSNQGQPIPQAVPMAPMHSQNVQNRNQQGAIRVNVRNQPNQDSQGGLRVPQQGPHSSPAARMVTQNMAPPNDPQARQSQPMSLQQSQQSQQSASGIHTRATSQQPTPAPPMKQIPNMMGNLQLPPGLPPLLVQHIMDENSTPEKARMIIERWQTLNASQAAAQAQFAQQPPGGQPSQADMELRNNQHRAMQEMANARAMQGGVSQPMQQQQSTTGNAQLAMQNQASHQGTTGRPPGNSQARIMDTLQLPRPHIEQDYPGIQIPPQCTTWGHFKAWLERNPSAIPEGSRQRLGEIQHAHFQSYRQRQMNGTMRNYRGLHHANIEQAQQMNVVPPAQMGQVQQRQHDQPKPPVSNIPEWILENGANVQLRPPSLEEVQTFRAKAGPTANNQNDQAIRAFLMSERLKYIRNANPALAQQIEASHRKQAVVQPQITGPNQFTHPMVSGANPQVQQQQLASRGQAMHLIPNSGPQNVVAQHPQSSQMIQQAQMLFQSQRRQQMESSAATQGGQVNGVEMPRNPALNPQQLAQMTAEQKNQLEMDLKARSTAAVAQQAQANKVPVSGKLQGLPPQMVLSAEKEQQFNHIITEAQRNTIRGPGLPFDQATKEMMAGKCRQFMPLISRVELCVRPFFAYTGNASVTEDVVRSVSMEVSR